MYIYFTDGAVTRKLISIELFDNGTVEYINTFGEYRHCGIDDILKITSGLNATNN